MDRYLPGGHLDHMFRQTRAHHALLSEMADRKAGMLITLSSLCITVSLGVLAWAEAAEFWAVVTLMGFCAATILLSAFVSMPKLGRRRPNPDDRLFNLLFFGDFHDLPYEDYERRVAQMSSSTDTAYEAQVREVYVLGQYLARHKYRYLAWAYAVFMAGIVATMAVWSIGRGLLWATA